MTKNKTNLMLAVTLIICFFTGFLMHPLHNMTAIKILHGVSAIVFVILVIVHVFQHSRK